MIACPAASAIGEERNKGLFLSLRLCFHGRIENGKPQVAASLRPDIRVTLRNAQGKYLAQDDHGIFFTHDRSAAMVFSYRADCVAEQLALLQETHGVALAVEPVPPEEIYERCDRCGDLFMPWMIYFDGQQFMCAECRSQRTRGRRVKEVK